MVTTVSTNYHYNIDAWQFFSSSSLNRTIRPLPNQAAGATLVQYSLSGLHGQTRLCRAGQDHPGDPGVGSPMFKLPEPSGSEGRGEVSQGPGGGGAGAGRRRGHPFGCTAQMSKVSYLLLSDKYIGCRRSRIT